MIKKCKICSKLMFVPDHGRFLNLALSLEGYKCKACLLDVKLTCKHGYFIEYVKLGNISITRCSCPECNK